MPASSPLPYCPGTAAGMDNRLRPLRGSRPRRAEARRDTTTTSRNRRRSGEAKSAAAIPRLDQLFSHVGLAVNLNRQPIHAFVPGTHPPTKLRPARPHARALGLGQDSCRGSDRTTDRATTGNPSRNRTSTVAVSPTARGRHANQHANCDRISRHGAVPSANGTSSVPR